MNSTVMDRHLNYVRSMTQKVTDGNSKTIEYPIGTRLEKRFLYIKNRHKYLKWDKGTIINYRPNWSKPYLIYFDDNTINWYSLSSLRSCYQILSFPNDEDYHISGQQEGIRKRLTNEVRPGLYTLIYLIRHNDNLEKGLVISYNRETNQHTVLLENDVVSLILNDRVKYGGTHKWFTLNTPSPSENIIPTNTVCYSEYCQNIGKYRILNDKYCCDQCTQGRLSIGRCPY